MTLSDKFHKMLSGHEEDPEAFARIAGVVLAAPESAERDGLLALMYHEGIGVPVDMDRCFDYAEKAVSGNDALGYFMLGYLCDNAETPDQAHGGPRQKYDHYGAERFYAGCADMDSRWREPASLWLGDYYMNMAQGGDPEVGIEYYASIAEHNAEASGKLSDYYWKRVMPDYYYWKQVVPEYSQDEDWDLLFKWTQLAAKLAPEEYAYRMGWIYADGIGCERSLGQAADCFSEAYACGDLRGAKAVAQLLEEFMEENPDLTPEERSECEAAIKEWNTCADSRHADDSHEMPDEQE